MTGRVSRIRALNTGDVLRLWAAAVLLPWLYVAVIVLPFARLRTGLLCVSDRLPVPGSPKAKRVVWAVTTADRYIPGARKCLVRSLTTELLLRLYGHRPDHRIGIDKTVDGGVKAHSWLEYEGEIIIGDLPNLGRYEPLPPLEAPV